MQSQNRTRVRRRVLACARCRKRKLSVLPPIFPRYIYAVLMESSATARSPSARDVSMLASSVLALIHLHSARPLAALLTTSRLTSPAQRVPTVLPRSSAQASHRQPSRMHQSKTKVRINPRIPPTTTEPTSVPSPTHSSTRSWRTLPQHSSASQKQGPSYSASSKELSCPPEKVPLDPPTWMKITPDQSSTLGQPRASSMT
jgi:hypothetical protein